MRRFEYVNRMISDGVEMLAPKFSLPTRATKNSAGYDFICPEDTMVTYEGVTYVKTGVKAYMQDDEILMLCNRSSNPKKKQLVLINGVRDNRCGFRR